MKSRARARKEDYIIGRRIRRFRLLRGITQKALAECLGVSAQQLQKYENGINKISAARLQRVAQVLNIPVINFYETASNLDGLSINEETRSLLISFEAIPSLRLRKMLVMQTKLLAREFNRLNTGDSPIIH